MFEIVQFIYRSKILFSNTMNNDSNNTNNNGLNRWVRCFVYYFENNIKEKNNFNSLN